MIVLPLVAQPVLMFGFKFGVAGGIGVLCVALLLLAVLAGEEAAFLYGIFALMAGMLLGLLGRIRVIEFLVSGVAAAMLALEKRASAGSFASRPKVTPGTSREFLSQTL